MTASWKGMEVFNSVLFKKVGGVERGRKQGVEKAEIGKQQLSTLRCRTDAVTEAVR